MIMNSPLAPQRTHRLALVEPALCNQLHHTRHQIGAEQVYTDSCITTESISLDYFTTKNPP